MPPDAPNPADEQAPIEGGKQLGPRLTLVPTPIGNLGDITLRALEVLRQADRIACEDTRNTAKLLHLLEIPHTEKLLTLHAHNEHQRVPAVLDEVVRRNWHLAYASDAGTPAISDPGFLLVREAYARDIAVDCLPGPAALIPALVLSGLPADRFVFEGFLPHKKGRKTRLEALVPETRTIVLYESPHRIGRLLSELLANLGPDRPVAVGRELTKKFQEVRRGTLTELNAYYEQHPTKGEFVVVVGGQP